MLNCVCVGERRRALRLLLKEVSQHPKNDNVLCETDIEPDAVRRKVCGGDCSGYVRQIITSVASQHQLERLHSTESELKAMYHRFGLLRQRGVALSDARVYGQTIDTYAIDYMKGGMKVPSNEDGHQHHRTLMQFLFAGSPDSPTPIRTFR